MIGRRAVVGLSLLCALLFSALVVQSASAALTTSKNTTAFTCVKDASKTGDFKDSHCDEEGEKGKEEFKHEQIAIAKEKESPKLTAVATTNTTNAVLKGEVVGGGKVTITCTVVKNNTANSTMHNFEPEKTQHTVTGTVETEFKTCTVTELKNCTVAEPIVSKANVHGVEGMEGPNKEANAMGLEFVGNIENANKEKEIFVEIEFLGGTCVVKNTKFPVKGKVIATNGPLATSKQDKKASGATLVFTGANAMQELTLSGKASTFTLTATARMALTKEEEEKKEDKTNPISLTTTT